MSTTSPEYRTMVECTDTLTTAFKSNLLPISRSLFSKNLIPETCHAEMINENVSKDNRATHLALAVTNKVKENADHFHTLVEVLKSHDYYKDTLEKVLTTFQTGKLNILNSKISCNNIIWNYCMILHRNCA